MLQAVVTYTTASPAHAITMLRAAADRWLFEGQVRLAVAAGAEDWALTCAKYFVRAVDRVAARPDLNPLQRRQLEDVLYELCALDSLGDTLSADDEDDRNAALDGLDEAARLLAGAERLAA